MEPGAQYGDRLNQIDFRVTKIFRMAKGSIFEASVDVYNLFNSDAILTQQKCLWRHMAAPDDGHSAAVREVHGEV